MYRSLQIVGNARYGGATFLMLEWSKYLLQRGWDVDILCTDEVMLREARALPGARVIDTIFIPKEIRPGQDLRALAQLCALCSRARYDVVHTYTATPSFLGRMAARLVGVPVIVNHQGGWAVNPTSTRIERIIYTPLEYLAVLASTRNICVSHAEEQHARRYHLAPPHKLVTICNGIDAQPFVDATRNGAGAALRQELGLHDEHLVIGTTGRLVPGKDNASLIQAMAAFRTLGGGRPFVLLIAGDGTERPELEALIGCLGLHEQVRLLGLRRDIPAFLAALDVYVTASLTEGMSVGLLEAMAAGKPIIATAIPPNAELITHEETGLLVPGSAPQQIAAALARYVREPELAQRCAAAAQQRALEGYSLERMFRETWELYNDLLQAKRLRPMQVRKEGI